MVSFKGDEVVEGVKLMWQTVATDKVLGVLILRNDEGPVSAFPANGMDYEVGDLLGNATVIFSSQDRSHDATIIDENVEIGMLYDYSGWAKYDHNLYAADTLPINVLITAVRDNHGQLPKTFALQQNYPNPFNPETEIQFQVPKPSHVVISIFNALGQQVKKLVDKDYEPGYHALNWDATDDRSQPVSSGVYLYRIRAGEFYQVKKMVLLR